MRTPDEVLARVRTRLADRWAPTIWAEATVSLANQPPTQPGEVAADSEDGNAGAASWPHTVPLGRPSSADLGANFGTFTRQVHDWRAWATQNHVALVEDTRRVSGTTHRIPSRVVVSDLDAAARLASGEWPDLIQVARERARAIRDQHPIATDPVRALRSSAQLTAVDFDIAGRVAVWFANRSTTNGHQPVALTPRQVPIEGVHAKWLNNHHALVRNLAGIDDLHLAPGHPPRIHFTYLDPDHLITGRRHDSYSVGDHVQLPYPPRVVLISENKDTAVGFPPIPGGIAIEGGGNGGGTIAGTPWIRHAPLVIYWGDLDIDGLRILNEFRRAGVPAISVLMDLATYHAYARFGTNSDKNGQPINIKPGPSPEHLTTTERELYDHLTSPGATVLRIEQERIPLTVAAEHVARTAEWATSKTTQPHHEAPPERCN